MLTHSAPLRHWLIFLEMKCNGKQIDHWQFQMQLFQLNCFYFCYAWCLQWIHRFIDLVCLVRDKQTVVKTTCNSYWRLYVLIHILQIVYWCLWLYFIWDSWLHLVRVVVVFFLLLFLFVFQWVLLMHQNECDSAIECYIVQKQMKITVWIFFFRILTQYPTIFHS